MRIPRLIQRIRSVPVSDLHVDCILEGTFFKKRKRQYIYIFLEATHQLHPSQFHSLARGSSAQSSPSCAAMPPSTGT